MAIERVALIFDNKARPETTGVYCRPALGSLVEVEHFLPTELSRIPREGFDLYLRIDDGLDYTLPADLHPCAWWAIDTHLDFESCLAKAGDKRFDICFIGNLFPGERGDLVRLIQSRYSNCFVGQRYFEQMAETYSASRIVFNRSIRNDINMRVFEAVACGSLLLTNDLSDNGQAGLFQDSVHLATYRDAEELLDKTAYYLAHEDVRERIAAVGREEVLAKHTYRHRMERLLAEVEMQIAVGSCIQGSGVANEERRPRDENRQASNPSTVQRYNSSTHRDHAYFEFSRPELVALVPEAARRVLDIGCGAGRVGAAIKARQQAEVVGIELDAQAAAEAQDRLDRVLVGNIEQMELDLPPQSFDAILCGDVLEHLSDPASVLRRARQWVKPDGRLIASIPNIRHQSVLRALLDGNWTYEPAGLLDRDHLRFFTRREVEKLFYRSGFSIHEIHAVPGPGYDEWVDRGRPNEVKVGRLHIGGMSDTEAEEFYAYQYLLSALPAALPEHGLTSIVIVTHNQVAYTRQCVDNIRERTDELYELVFVDNASTDGTVEYLRSLEGAKVLTNADNRGFPAAVNQGIRVATGKQILLLNNDCIVTTAWLRRLLRALEIDSRIGLVGPCSNNVSGSQQVTVRYEELESLDGFAWDWGKKHDQIIADTDRLVGFCLVIRRELIDKMGALDERFGMGCFEDDDYCLRALRAGYRVVIARDAFVHHFGGRTFVGSGVSFADLMQRNQQLFREKLNQMAIESGRNGNAARPDEPREQVSHGSRKHDFHPAHQGGLLLSRSQIRLSLCLIMRDNSGTIVQCLESIRPWVDEMVCVDTGSQDETPRIAERLGARLHYFPWCDSFSAARNESFRHARGHWIFWMDSDDTIDRENGHKLRQLAYAETDPAVLAYSMKVHCPSPGKNGDTEVTVVDQIKLVRNLPELRWDRRIHEQIIPAIRRAGGEIAFTNVYLVHSGADRSPEGRRSKLERDLRLLNLELQEYPDHPFTLFNLGMTYLDAGDYQRATVYLNRSIERSGESESHLRKAYAMLVSSHAQLRHCQIADEIGQQGLRLFPRDAELRFREAALLHDFGRLAEAAESYRKILETDEEPHFASVERGIKGYLTRHNLAVIYADMGDLASAEQQWRLALAEMPSFEPAKQGLHDIVRESAAATCAVSLSACVTNRISLTGSPRLSGL
ncbi:MAG: glycosyltransferase [Planctomycetes bacterium]|nr:glycosyltransferase [Planctomycetota bacterium]